ncbi:hypothetical protein LUX32_49420 [Actinomadura madurae]|nr:hypothetical protein [Actinomadura madurae]
MPDQHVCERVHLVLGDHQRRGQNDVGSRRAHDDPVGTGTGLHLGGVAVELDAQHQPHPADLADVAQLFERPERSQQPLPQLRGAIQQALALQDVDVGECHGRANGMAVVGEAVEEGSAPGELQHPPSDQDGAHGDVTAGDALRGDDHVRLDAVPLGGEPVTGAAERRDDLIDDEQDAVAAQHVLDPLPVAVRRRHHAAHAERGLADERGDVLRADRRDPLLQLGDEHVRRVRAVLQPVGLGEVLDPGHERTVAGAQPVHPGGGQGSRAHAVIPARPGEDDGPLRVTGVMVRQPREFDGGLVALRSAVGEEHPLDARGGEPEEPLGEPDGRLVRVVAERRVELQLRDLLGGHGGQFLAAVPDRALPETTGAVDERPAGDVPQRGTVAPVDDERFQGRADDGMRVDHRPHVRLGELLRMRRVLGHGSAPPYSRTDTDLGSR